MHRQHIQNCELASENTKIFYVRLFLCFWYKAVDVVDSCRNDVRRDFRVYSIFEYT